MYINVIDLLMSNTKRTICMLYSWEKEVYRKYHHLGKQVSEYEKKSEYLKQKR